MTQEYHTYEQLLDMQGGRLLFDDLTAHRVVSNYMRAVEAKLALLQRDPVRTDLLFTAVVSFFEGLSVMRYMLDMARSSTTPQQLDEVFAMLDNALREGHEMLSALRDGGYRAH